MDSFRILENSERSFGEMAGNDILIDHGLQARKYIDTQFCSLYKIRDEVQFSIYGKHKFNKNY